MSTVKETPVKEKSLYSVDYKKDFKNPVYGSKTKPEVIMVPTIQ